MNYTTLFLTAIISLISCQQIDPIEDLIPKKFEKISQLAALNGLGPVLHEAVGTIAVTDLKSFGSEALWGGDAATGISGSFYDATGRVLHGPIVMGDIVVHPDIDIQYYSSQGEHRKTVQNYMGFNQIISLFPINGGEVPLVEESIYLPRQLYVHDPFVRGGEGRISTGSTINWNADPNNHNGVFILLDYLPADEENAGLPSVDYLAHQKLLYTEDSGIYRFKPSDFQKIPDGGYTNILIGRGDYVFATGTDQETYIVYSFSGATTSFYIDK
ncbi:MAG: hypothetical protein AAFW73_09360 [Bacteroidota bacterium]